MSRQFFRIVPICDIGVIVSSVSSRERFRPFIKSAKLSTFVEGLAENDDNDDEDDKDEDDSRLVFTVTP